MLKIITIAALFLVGLSGCTFFSKGPDTFLSNMETREPGPNDPRTESESEAFYSYLVGELAFDEQDFDTAEENFARASELIDLPSATVHEKLAEMYVRSGNLSEALEESQRLLEAEPDNIEYRLLHAGILESGGQLDQAIKIYEELLPKNPESAEIYVLLANAYVKNQNLPAAELVLKKGEQAQPANLLILYNLGRISEAQKNTDQALSYYMKTFNSDPQNGLVVPDIIRAYLEKQDYDELEKFARKVLDNQPQNVLVRKLLSQLLLGRSELKEALEQFSALEDMQERIGIDTRLKIARMQMNAQNYPEAIRQLLLALADDPENGEARFYLASLYAAQGRSADAFAEVEKIKPGDKFYSRAKVFEGFLWRQEGNSEAAEKSFRDIHKIEPNDVKIIYYLIAVLKDRKKYAEADQLFNRALELKPGNERLLFQHAVLLHEMGKAAESYERMQAVLEANPDNADALNFVAFAMAEQGSDLELALAKVERALQITPNEPYYLDTLGWIHYKLGNFDEAHKNIALALEQLPQDPEINEHFADVLLALKQTRSAYEYYKKVIEILVSQDKTESDTLLRKRIEEKLSKIQLTDGND